MPSNDLEVLYLAMQRYSATTGRGAVLLTPELDGKDYDAVYSKLPDDELVANILSGELERVRQAGQLVRIDDA